MTTRYKQYIYKNGEWILLGGTGSGNVVSNTYLLKAAGQNGVTHATTTSGNTYLNLVENGAVTDKINFYPNGGLSITSDATGKILFTNTGVRTVTQKSNGILTVNTGGTSADVTVYTLPTAASNTLGGIKVGSNLSIDANGVLSGKAGTVTGITLIAGTGISLDTNNTAITTSGSRTITNSGVRDVTESTNNGYISVDKGGTVKQVPIHGLAAAAYKAVDTSIAASSTSANLTTSAAVASFVEGKGYVTSSGITSVTAASGVGISATTTGSSVALTNTGVRAVSEGTANGTISVNTNGTTTDVTVHGLGSNAFSSTSYLPLAGGTMTGNITLGSETRIAAEIKRKKADGGGWAYAPYRFIGNDGVTFANIGVYGGQDELTYMYIGPEDWSSSNNLRIYPNGTISAKNFTGDVTGVASGNLTNVAYDSTNKRLTKTIGGTTSDIVTLATL